MTDEEILKAFHLCNTDTDCDNSDCPYKDMISGCIPALNNDITSRFTELKSENAALRERLDKAVELPCKIGDKVYAIFPIEDELKILDGTFVGIEEVVSDFKGCMCAIIVRQAKDGHYFNTYWDLMQFNKTWWADKGIAESKLAEVMGNHGM